MAGKRKTIDISIGNIHTDHPQQIIAGLYHGASSLKNYDIHFFLGSESGALYRGLAHMGTDFDYQYLNLYKYSCYDDVDGFIIAIGSIFTLQRNIADRKEYVASYGSRPCVVLEDTIAPENGCYIISDNYHGMYTNVNHLIEEHGCRNILFLSGPEGNKDSLERQAAYIDCMKDHDLPVTDSMIAVGDYSEYVDAQVRQLFDSNVHIDAIVSANDEMTVAIYRECDRRHLEIGRDIAVVGFDNMQVARIARPPLTTVRQRSYYLGERAIRTVVELIGGINHGPQRIPTDFIRRSSCGCDEHLISLDQTDDDSLSNAAESTRQMLHRSMLGPFLLRELIQLADNEEKFFSRIANVLKELGAKSSELYLLPEPVAVSAAQADWQPPEEIHLAFRQRGENIHTFYDGDQPVIQKGEGLFRQDDDADETTHVYFTFLLFDGETQYGILSAETIPEEVSFFYILSLQIGTALHFMEITKQQNAYRKMLTEQNAILNYNAYNDALTGIRNRRGVTEELDRFCAENAGKKAVLLIADLDHLKQINDNYGHSEGDFAIQTGAKFLLEACGENAVLGRIGGDEYLAYLPADHFAGIESEELKLRISEIARAFNDDSEKPYYVELSVGATSFTCSSGTNLADLTKAADQNLYLAKKNRREFVGRTDRQEG